MKKNLKNQNGMAIIAVILIVIIACVAGLAAFLGVRMVVTGEHFLQPFENLGWIELEDDESDKKDDKDDDKKSKKDKENDEEDDDDDEKDTGKKESSNKNSSLDSRLSAAAKEKCVEHYYGMMTLEELSKGSSDVYADLYKLLKLEVDVYAKDDKAIEIVFSIRMKDFLEKAYEEYEDEFVEAGYETYDEFEEYMSSVFEQSFDLGFNSATKDSEVSKYIEKYNEDGDIQVYITEEGFDYLYDAYEIEEGKNDIKTLIEAIEDAMGIEIDKV